MTAPVTKGYPNGWALLSDLAARRGVPAGAHLQVADRCNHTCQHCYQIQGMKGELSFEDVARVIDDLAAQGVMTLNVSGGEATLRHDLVDILAHARRRGFALRLYTNAFLIDEAYADRLAAVGLYEVHVSVYSAVPAEHDAVTCVPGSFARTVAGIRALRARNMRVVMKSPATALSTEGAPGVERLANELGCRFRPSASMTPMENGDLTPLGVAAGPEQLVAAGLLPPWKPSPDAAKVQAKYAAVGPCGVGRSGVVILPNGDVMPCTDTPVRLGNATEGGLTGALASPEMEVFRDLTWARVHGCRDCELIAACHRCHATALHEGGDYLGPYPTACAHARARYAAGIRAAGLGAVEILSPSSACEEGRDPRVGPYRIEGEGRIRPVADVRTADDEALVTRHPWIRRAGPPAEQAPVPVSRLIRLRASGDTTRT